MSTNAVHTDPVCGMQVTESESAERSDYQDRTYYFCSRDCRVAFEKSPEPYAGTANANAPSDDRR